MHYRRDSTVNLQVNEAKQQVHCTVDVLYRSSAASLILSDRCP